MALRNTVLFGILAATAVMGLPDPAQRWHRHAKAVTVTAPAETVTVTVTAPCAGAGAVTGAPAAPVPNGNTATSVAANNEECVFEDDCGDKPTSANTSAPVLNTASPPNPAAGDQTNPKTPLAGISSLAPMVDNVIGHVGAPTPPGSTTPQQTDTPAVPPTAGGDIAPAADTTASATVPPAGDGKHDVFAHYMLGIVAGHTAADWEKDFKFAQQYGVSAFALNFGNTDSYTDAQLDLAYAAAEKTGFKVFMSFDFAYYKADNPADAAAIADKVKKYGKLPGAYLVDGKPLVSSFLGDGMDWSAVAQAAGVEIAAMPNTNSADPSGSKGIAGFLSWEPWASENNLPVNKEVSLAQDARFFTATEGAHLDYIMPISPWFFTHYSPETYNKNYLFKSEDLWVERWNQALEAGGAGKARFLEILTWNDFGESSYLVDPAATEHGDDPNETWSKGFSHAALMDVAKPYITAFKSGQKAPVVEKDSAVWWHRPHLKTASCDATDKCKAKPKGADIVEDAVFVAVMTKSGGTLTVTSGANAPVVSEVKAGVQMVKVPMGVGAQTFELKTADGSLQGKSDHEVSADCINGQYNFNIAVGTFA